MFFSYNVPIAVRVENYLNINPNPHGLFLNDFTQCDMHDYYIGVVVPYHFFPPSCLNFRPWAESPRSIKKV